MLENKNFIEQLREISTLDLKTSENRGEPVIQQTQRNMLKADLMAGLKDYLEQILDGDANTRVANVYMLGSTEGIGIEIENEYIAEKLGNDGMITLTLDLKFKNLNYDAYFEADAAEVERANKAVKAEKSAAKKAKQKKQ